MGLNQDSSKAKVQATDLAQPADLAQTTAASSVGKELLRFIGESQSRSILDTSFALGSINLIAIPELTTKEVLKKSSTADLLKTINYFDELVQASCRANFQDDANKFANVLLKGSAACRDSLFKGEVEKTFKLFGLTNFIDTGSLDFISNAYTELESRFDRELKASITEKPEKLRQFVSELPKNELRGLQKLVAPVYRLAAKVYPAEDLATAVIETVAKKEISGQNNLGKINFIKFLHEAKD